MLYIYKLVSHASLGKKFAVLLSADDTEYAKKVYEGVFRGFHENAGEREGFFVRRVRDHRLPQHPRFHREESSWHLLQSPDPKPSARRENRAVDHRMGHRGQNRPFLIIVKALFVAQN